MLCDSDQVDASECFAANVAFMKRHTQIVLLQNGEAAVAIRCGNCKNSLRRET